jgi:hypothetical protein
VLSVPVFRCHEIVTLRAVIVSLGLSLLARQSKTCIPVQLRLSRALCSANQAATLDVGVQPCSKFEGCVVQLRVDHRDHMDL